MKRPDPNQGSLFGSDPARPAPVPVPPERVDAELPGQTFLPLTTAPQIAPVSMPAAPAVFNVTSAATPGRFNVLGAALAYLETAPKGWHRCEYYGAGAFSRYTEGARAMAFVYQWAGSWLWDVREPFKDGETLASSQYGHGKVTSLGEAQADAITALEAVERR